MRTIGSLTRNRRLLLTVALLAFAAAAASVPFFSLGLRVEAGPAGALETPSIEARDYELNFASLKRLEAKARQAPSRWRWSGFVFVDRASEYEFLLEAEGRVDLYVDSKPVIAPSEAAAGSRTGRIALDRGQHLLVADYEPAGPESPFELKWRLSGESRFVPIPPSRLSTRGLSPLRWRLRSWVPQAVTGLALAFSVAILVLLSRWLLRVLALPPIDRRLLALAVAVIGLGITWDWPGTGWAADELTPDVVRVPLDMWFSGWHDKYPPFHYMVLTLVYAPLLIADALGMLAAWASTGFAVMMLLGRVTSVLMALGTLVIVRAIADRFHGSQAANWAVVCCLSFLPFAFLAKFANLEAPYVFWFMAAVWCWVRAEESPAARWTAGLGITAALSIASKDQAYGLFALPALLIAVRWIRTRGVDGIRDAGIAAGASIVAFALAHNIPFGLGGFIGHVNDIVGPASDGYYRMFPSSPAGWLSLTKVTLILMTWCVGAAGLLVLALGFKVRPTRSPDPRIWLLIPAASYLLTFVAVIGYQYDRFLLPIVVLLAIPAGAGVEALMRHRPSAISRPVAALVVLAVLLWRPLSLNAMMIMDARGRAERWLSGHARTAVVGSFGLDLYLPRLQDFERRFLDGSIEDTIRQRPDFIVVNTEHMRRFPAGSPRALWFDWLSGGAAPYREVFRQKAPVLAPSVGVFREMHDPMESPFTNLDKVNPEIAIFRRIPE